MDNLLSKLILLPPGRKAILCKIHPAVQNNRINPLQAKQVFIFSLLLLSHLPLYAQVTNPADTIIVPPFDSLATPPSLPLDTLGPLASGGITYSKDSLDAPVDYTAVDSMIYDIADKKIHLYGDAKVNYTTISLEADHIIFDWETNIVTATGMPDSTGRMAGLPVFQDGEQNFTADSMRYNFQTRKGIVYEVTTQQNDVIVRGERSKFIVADQKDTTAQDYVYSRGAIFTTCNHPDPHYGIRSRKQKVVPNKLVVIGPSNLEIMGVPTPLWLPFGFFPISSGRQTGLMFPRDYEYSDQWGFGLRDVGWFFPLGEHFNLTLTGNIYLKGTWGVNARSQYRKRYKYNGSFDLGFDSRRSEDNEGNISRPKSFVFRWSHRQDRNAHPTNTFGGSINIQTNNYQSRVNNDAQSVLQNQLNSNLSFNKIWLGKPYSFTASFSHSQNSATRNVTVNFPQLQFVTQAIYPFKRKERTGPERWYESIVLRYQSEVRNRFQATDTTLFTQRTLDEAQFGVRQQANLGTSFKVLKYFNLNPGINYEEVWYLRSIEKTFDPTLVIENDTFVDPDDPTLISVVPDTVGYGAVDTDTLTGFRSFRQYNASLSLNTQIFGTMRFRKGWLRGLRHVIKPSLSFSFSPNYLNPDLGYYRFVQTDTRFPDDPQRYSIFDGGIYGAPPASGRRMALSYSLNNIFEAKYFSRKDSTDKKFKLFDNIVVSGNYNFVADSLKWSQVNVSGTTRFFKGVTTLSLRAVFDPYIQNENGRRVNVTQWSRNGRLLRFDNANARFASNLTVGKIRALFQGETEEVVEDLSAPRPDRNEPEPEDFLSLFENFRISHNLTLSWEDLPDGRDTFKINTHSINVVGNIKLTDKWDITIGSFGYDFVRKGFTYPSVGFNRDLHCWQMGMTWQPTRGTYAFYIQVKPGTLDFLRIPYERNNADAIRAFQ